MSRMANNKIKKRMVESSMPEADLTDSITQQYKDWQTRVKAANHADSAYIRFKGNINGEIVAVNTNTKQTYGTFDIDTGENTVDNEIIESQQPKIKENYYFERELPQHKSKQHGPFLTQKQVLQDIYKCCNGDLFLQHPITTSECDIVIRQRNGKWFWTYTITANHTQCTDTDSGYFPNKVTFNNNDDFGYNQSEINDTVELDKFQIGDVVTIAGDVRYVGKTGTIIDFNNSKTLAIVDLGKYGERSYYISDLQKAEDDDLYESKKITRRRRLS